MLLLKFVLFACYVAGSYCMSLECYRAYREDCIEYDKGEPEMPKTTEDVRDFCTNIIPLARCHIGVMEKCAKNEDFYEQDEDVERLRKSVKFIESVCDEDSQIFQVITDNLNCVTSTLQSIDDLCYWRGINDTYYTYYRKELEDLVDERCAFDAWYVFCFLARYDVECGSDVRDAVSEILENVNFFSYYCREARQERLSYFEDAFKSQFELGKTGEDALEGVFQVIRKKEQ